MTDAAVQVHVEGAAGRRGEDAGRQVQGRVKGLKEEETIWTMIMRVQMETL